jgi:hypothetical protein
MQVAETARLRVRWFDASDSAFIVEFLNQPSWIRFIGDKGVGRARTHCTISSADRSQCTEALDTACLQWN